MAEPKEPAPPEPIPAPVVKGGIWDFAAALRIVRLASGLSQRQLALKMGLPRTYISKLERGKARPAIRSIHRMAIALEIPAWGLIDIAEACAAA